MAPGLLAATMMSTVWLGLVASSIATATQPDEAGDEACALQVKSQSVEASRHWPGCDFFTPCQDATDRSCYWEAETKCCMDDKCKGCSGEQCGYCREEHKKECCESSFQESYKGHYPEICSFMKPHCDSYTPCKDIYGGEGLGCMWGEEAKCCLNDKCNGCSGEQCGYCRDKVENVDACCAATYYPNRPAPQICQAWFDKTIDVPAPTVKPSCDPVGNCHHHYGSDGLTCLWGEEAKCCLDEQCHGCSGEQCIYCKADTQKINVCCSSTYTAGRSPPSVCQSWYDHYIGR